VPLIVLAHSIPPVRIDVPLPGGSATDDARWTSRSALGHG